MRGYNYGKILAWSIGFGAVGWQLVTLFSMLSNPLHAVVQWEDNMFILSFETGLLVLGFLLLAFFMPEMVRKK